jgi:methylated-DNA-[protein]-cysteine S-methyltransferase
MKYNHTSLRAACTAQCSLPSPLGTILLARTQHGIAGLWFEGQKDHPGSFAAPERPDDALLGAATAQLRDYFAGRGVTFDVPLDLHGTPFQRSVWQALLDIPSGRTCSYGDIARQVGSPQGMRAVGGAVGRNPVSIIVPCHRVIGTSGALTGYTGGMDRKRALLALENIAF